MKLTLFFLIFCGVFCQAQNETIKEGEAKSDTLREVTQFAVFPGCEKYLGDNKNLYKCFAESLRNSFEDELELNGIPEKFEKKYKAKKQNSKSEIRISASINFSVTKTGRLEVLGLKEGSDEQLGKDASAILTELFNKTIVEPAQLSDGTPVNLTLHIPITLVF